MTKINQHLNALRLPITLQLEITNKCNMKCSFCYNNSGEMSHDELTKEEWLNFSRNVVALGGVFQCVISGGEPTLCKETVIELMEIFDASGTAFRLISNGYDFDEAFVQHIKKYRWYWVQISLDSYSPEKHNHIRGNHNAFNNAVSAIKLLTTYGIPVSIATVVTKENMNDMEDIIKLSISHKVNQIIFSSVLYSGRAVNEKNFFSTEEAFIKEFDRLEKKYADFIILERAATYKEQIQKIISSPISSLIVRPNGDVKLDCILPFVVGNIKTDDIQSIWMKAKKIYDENFFQNYINEALNNKYNVVANNTNNDIFY